MFGLLKSKIQWVKIGKGALYAPYLYSKLLKNIQ